MLRLGLLALITACAAHPVPAEPTLPPAIPTSCLLGEEGESRSHLLARILVDACTAQPTDEVLIEHTLLILGSCHFGTQTCVRKACVRLRREDEEPESTRHNALLSVPPR